MSTITTRAGKGSPLTNNEVDANFTNLNTDKAELSGAAFTGAITTTSTVDGRDVATDGSKLDGIEASADVTDTTNVTAAGALMDSEVTNLAQVKAFDSADYATAAQGTTADAALPKSGGAMTGAITTNSTFDGRDVATDGTKLDGIEASADVTDTANVTAAGALMDSELTSIASVKALNQGVATTDSPTFAGITLATADINSGTIDGTTIGASSASTGAFTTLTATGAFTSVGIDDNATSTAITIDSSENVGIGVVPKTWYSASTALEIGSMSFEDYGVSGANVSVFANNLYRNTSNAYVYKETDFAASYSQYNGVHTFNTAPSGTADSVATLTPVMKIDSSGNALVGRTSSLSSQLGSVSANTVVSAHGGLQSHATSAGILEHYNDETLLRSYGANAGSGELVFKVGGGGGSADSEAMRIDSSGTIKSSVNGAVANLILENDADTPYILFTESGAAQFFIGESSIVGGGAGYYDFYAVTGLGQRFFTNSVERMRIDSSGNLLVGKTALSIGVVGQELRTGGSSYITASSDTVLGLNRLSTEGTVLEIRKDSAIVGSIGTNVGRLSIGSGDTGVLFAGDIDAIYPANGIAARDSAIDLGVSGARFKNLYLSGKSIVGSGSFDGGGVIHNYGSDGNSRSWWAKTDTHGYGDFAIRQSTTQTGSTYQTRLLIDSSGNLLVGKTSTSQTTAGTVLYNNGQAYSTASGTQASVLTRLSNDGPIQIFYKDSSEVGSIGTNAATMYVSAPQAGGMKYSYLTSTNAVMLPVTTTGAYADGLHDLGYSAARFKDLWVTRTHIANNGSSYWTLDRGDGDGSLTFEDTGTERMRIDPYGRVLVNTTDDIGGARFNVEHPTDCIGCNLGPSASGTRYFMYFTYNGTNVGSIRGGPTSTAFTTSSDQRLKENIADADDAGSKVDAIQVRQFDWKADGSHQDYGMIAQELQAVAPEAVFGDADSEKMMGVDYSKLVPMLIKEIQSLRNRVAQLEE